MDENSPEKKNFILDCCNQHKSRLNYYNSQNDLHLAGYFAFKTKRSSEIQSKLSKKSSSTQKILGPSVYLSSPTFLSPTRSTKVLPSLKNHQRPNKISSKELLTLIEKYRYSN